VPELLGAETTAGDVDGLAAAMVLSKVLVGTAISDATGDAAVVAGGAVGATMGSSILVLGSGSLAEAARAPTPAPAAAPAMRGAALDSLSSSAREVEGVLVEG
jgi:hypothetical protein